LNDAVTEQVYGLARIGSAGLDPLECPREDRAVVRSAGGQLDGRATEDNAPFARHDGLDVRRRDEEPPARKEPATHHELVWIPDVRVEAELLDDTDSPAADLDAEALRTPEPVARITRVAPKTRKDGRHPGLGKERVAVENSVPGAVERR
jgi:hypothetical protein